jgi:hypothetical protein
LADSFQTVFAECGLTVKNKAVTGFMNSFQNVFTERELTMDDLAMTSFMNKFPVVVLQNRE